MIKIISLKDIINQYTGELHFKKNGVYECDRTLEYIGRGKHVVYYTIHKFSSKESWRYTHDDFYKNFVPLNENRKLKLDKINKINDN